MSIIRIGLLITYHGIWRNVDTPIGYQSQFQMVSGVSTLTVLKRNTCKMCTVNCRALNSLPKLNKSLELVLQCICTSTCPIQYYKSKQTLYHIFLFQISSIDSWRSMRVVRRTPDLRVSTEKSPYFASLSFNPVLSTAVAPQMFYAADGENACVKWVDVCGTQNTLYTARGSLLWGCRKMVSCGCLCKEILSMYFNISFGVVCSLP